MRRGRVLLLAVVGIALGCGGRPAAETGRDGSGYALSFACGDRFPDYCPPGEPCPEVPPGYSPCGSREGVPEVSADAGAFLGCVVNLPYAAAGKDGGTRQATCTCVTNGLQSDSNHAPPVWSCDL